MSSDLSVFFNDPITASDSVALEVPFGHNEVPANFPEDCIPKTLRDLGHDFHRANGIPAEYVWVAGLPVLSAAMGRSRVLRMGPDRLSVPIIWAGISGESGSGKTPAIELVVAPLDEIDIQRHREYERAFSLAEEQRKTDKHYPAPTPRHRLIVDDATMEALIRILARTPRGLLLKSEELIKVIAGLGQYKNGKGSDRQTMLSLWSGITTRVDRVGRGEDKTIFAEKPFCSVLGGVQPSEVPGLLSGEDGMAQRWLLAHFPGQKRQPISDKQMDPLHIQLWRKLVFNLVDIEGERELKFSNDAMWRFIRFRNDNVARSNSSVSKSVANFWGKVDVHVARLANLIHVACCVEKGEPIGTEVQEESVFMAEMLGIYFGANFESFTPKSKNLMAKFRDRDQDEVVDQIMDAARRMGGRITLSQIQRKHIGGIRTAHEVHQAAARCEEIYPGSIVSNERGGGRSVVVPDEV